MAISISYFSSFFFIRYLRLVVNTIAYLRYKSIPPPEDPEHSSEDVTIVLPTICDDCDQLQQSIESFIACKPYEILVVTTPDNRYEWICRLTESFKAQNIHVSRASFANKRLQICGAIEQIKTKFTILADDDVIWPSTIIPWLLAPFHNPDDRSGAVGTCQTTPLSKSDSFIASIFSFLGTAYIQRRNFEISATHFIDGGTSCMSGRTLAILTKIIQDTEFLEAFQGEEWSGRKLNADDDNFITRWLVKKGWSTWIQYDPACQIVTTLETNSDYLQQCLRWARSNWRSNIRSIFWDRHIWRQQPWCTYALHLTMFINFAILMDPLLFALLHFSTRASQNHFIYMCLLFVWVLLSKVIKLIPLFRRNPRDIRYIPVSILFGWFHSFIKLYAALTLNNQAWGSRQSQIEHSNTYQALRSFEEDCSKKD